MLFGNFMLLKNLIKIFVVGADYDCNIVTGSGFDMAPWHVL